jgi:putative ABC transport system permease protein
VKPYKINNFALILAGVGLAWDAIRGHKMRSFLTVLGVIIGTGTIIGVGSILTGFDGAVTNAIKGFGTDSVMVFKWQAGIRFGRRSREEWQRKPLTYENAIAIRERCPSVKGVSPYLFPGRGFHKAHYKGNDVLQLNLGGTDENYVAGGNAEMKTGRFFSGFENVHKEPVVVIGEDINKNLFGAEDAVGKELQVDGHSYRVIGVMLRPANSFPGQQDNRVLLPYFTMRKLEPSAMEHMIVVSAYPGQLPKAIDEVRGVLRQERRLKYNDPDNFGLSTAEQMIEDFRQVTSVTALVMVVLSSIGLLVGGIGTDEGDRRPQGAGRPQERHHYPVPDGGCGADLCRRTAGHGAGLGDLEGRADCFSDPADHCAAVGRRPGHHRQRGGWVVLRFMASEQSGAAGSGGSAPVRVIRL